MEYKNYHVNITVNKNGELLDPRVTKEVFHYHASSREDALAMAQRDIDIWKNKIAGWTSNNAAELSIEFGVVEVAA
jgi:hypothetical protein